MANLYLSFSDPQGNYFSVLFDSLDNIFNFVKILAFTLIHMQSYEGISGNDIPNLRKALPNCPDQTAEDTTQLNPGMTAGIFYSIWEIGELGDYPNDVINSPTGPFLTNKNPEELLKVK